MLTTTSVPFICKCTFVYCQIMTMIHASARQGSNYVIKIQLLFACTCCKIVCKHRRATQICTSFGRLIIYYHILHMKNMIRDKMTLSFHFVTLQCLDKTCQKLNYSDILYHKVFEYMYSNVNFVLV